MTARQMCLPFTGALLASVVSAHCLAQGGSGADGGASFTEPEPARLSLRVEPLVWFMGVSGDLDLPSTDALGNPDPTDIDTIGYDSPKFIGAGEAHIHWGEDYRITLRGYNFSDSQTLAAIADGQIGTLFFDEGSLISSSYTFGCYEAELSYKTYTFPPEVRNDKERDFFGTIELIVGVRVVELDWGVRRLSGGAFPGDATVGADEMFVQGMLGARLRIDLSETLGVDIEVVGSGLPLSGGPSSAMDVLVGGWWYPWPRIGLQLGYRAGWFFLGAEGDTEAQDFEFRGWNQGLQAGLTVWF